MFITRHEDRIDTPEAEAFISAETEAQSGLRGKPGFRWAMLLRSREEAARYVTVSMWQTPQHAESAGATSPDSKDSGALSYDVVTARGSMTPAVLAALVTWHVTTERASELVASWNAAYHAIEDRMGSRLLQDMDDDGVYVGLHVVTDGDKLGVTQLSSELNAGDGKTLQPEGLETYDVVLLTEA